MCYVPLKTHFPGSRDVLQLTVMVFHRLSFLGPNAQVFLGVLVVCGVGAAPLAGKWGKGYDSMDDKQAAMRAEAEVEAEAAAAKKK